jgi:hypothetical protein
MYYFGKKTTMKQTEIITFKCSPEFKQKLQKQAKKRKITVSKVIKEAFE